MDTLADRLKQARQLRELTQEQLADEAGVSQSTIGNIESGTRKRPRDLVSIANALGVTPEWLETGKDPTPSHDATAQGLPADRPSDARALVEELASIAKPLRPTLRKNLANLLVDLIENPSNALIEQTVTDIDRFFKAPG